MSGLKIMDFAQVWILNGIGNVKEKEVFYDYEDKKRYKNGFKYGCKMP